VSCISREKGKRKKWNKKFIDLIHEDLCNESCKNNSRCEKLLLKETIEKIKSFNEKKQNTQHIIKGINPFTKKELNIEKKFQDKISKLSELNKILLDENNRSFYLSLNKEFKRLYINENYIYLAKILPYTQKVDCSLIEEYNDFPYYVSIAKESDLSIYINDIQKAILECEADKLTILFQELVKFTSNDPESVESWLIRMLIFYTYNKHDQIIDFYENFYLPKGEYDSIYKIEFSYIYGYSLYQEIVHLSDDFEPNFNSILKLLESINILTRNTKEPRLLWIRIISCGLFYEHDELENHENKLIEIFGIDYSMKDENLVKKIDELIKVFGNISEFHDLQLRCIMNKAYLYALSNNENNYHLAKKIMEDTLGFPDNPIKKTGNYFDTYAYILMKMGFHSMSIKLLNDAITFFNIALSKTKSDKYIKMIKNDIKRCYEELSKYN
jgi:hypothetical protein